jgi:hypothetical protein
MVKVLEGAKILLIPDVFILKINDRRFGYQDEDRPKLIWDPQIEGQLRERILWILGPGRTSPIPKMYYCDPVDSDPDRDGPLPSWDGWELEIHIWTLKTEAYLREALAYRYLRVFEGTCIPSLYATVRISIFPKPISLHPIVDFVPGLAIEHIPGSTWVPSRSASTCPRPRKPYFSAPPRHCHPDSRRALPPPRPPPPERRLVELA